MKPKLDTKKINDWLNANDRSIAWLSRQLGVPESTMYFRMLNGTMLDIDKISSLMGCEPTDLIEMVE
ncbi:MAG: hypothetical protein WBN66_03670 [Smithella sp.]